MSTRNNLLIIFNGLLILNYVLWSVSIHNQFTTGLLIIFLTLTTLVLLKESESKNLNIFIFALLIASWGIQCWQWDAQTIWLFHAKRIFYDSNLYSQLDGYSYCCMNDYPNMVPSLSASIANTVGFWNEILPKLSSIFFLITPLILLTNYFKSNLIKTVFLIFILFFGKKFLINGYIDALLALNFMGLIILIEKNKALKNLILIIISSCVLVVMKNEGVVLYLIFLISLLITNKFDKKFIFLTIPYLFYFFSWKYFVNQTDIQNFMNLGYDSLLRLYDRIINFNDLFTILYSICNQIYPYLVLLLFTLCFKNNIKKIGILNPIFLNFIGYITILIVIYLVTPVDLKTHIGQSIDRITMPLQIILIISFLKNLEFLLKDKLEQNNLGL